MRPEVVGGFAAGYRRQSGLACRELLPGRPAVEGTAANELARACRLADYAARVWVVWAAEDASERSMQVAEVARSLSLVRGAAAARAGAVSLRPAMALVDGPVRLTVWLALRSLDAAAGMRDGRAVDWLECAVLAAYTAGQCLAQAAVATGQPGDGLSMLHAVSRELTEPPADYAPVGSSACTRAISA